MAHWLIDAASGLLGAILAATPVALWVAWTPTVLFVVVAAAIAGAGLLVLLHEFAHGEARQSGASDQIGRAHV